MSGITLRPYVAADEDAAIALWQRTWQKHYPHIDFAEREPRFRERWRSELIPKARAVVAEENGAIAGFATVDGDGYLDQFAVAPERWGGPTASALMAEAKRLSPTGIFLFVNKDNARAVRFYEKHGFVDDGEDKNPMSGLPVNRMRWTP